MIFLKNDKNWKFNEVDKNCKLQKWHFSKIHLPAGPFTYTPGENSKKIEKKWPRAGEKIFLRLKNVKIVRHVSGLKSWGYETM